MCTFTLRSVLAIGMAVIVGSCAGPADEIDPPTDAGPPPRFALPPELPTMPSAQLEYVPRASDVPRGPFVSRVIVPGRRVAQRVLLLGATGTEPAYLEAQAALDRIGAPYRAPRAAPHLVRAGLRARG